MAGAWQKTKAALVGLGTAGATLVTVLTLSASVAHAALEDQAIKFKRPAPSPELQARYDAYMRNIEPVYYPPVPFGWQVVINNDNTVSYIHANASDGADHTTTIKMRYTRKTANMDAECYMRNYTYSHSCTNMFKQGTGFYTADCLESNTFAIVIGEVDNLYVIELTGDYSNAARAIIESYVSDIITGKKVFADRNIGNMRDRDDMPPAEVAPDAAPAAAAESQAAPDAAAAEAAPDDDAATEGDAAATEEDEGFFSWLPF